MKRNRGYVGFLLLLITIAIIGFIMWRKDLFTNGVAVPLDESGKPVNTFDSQINAVQKAKDSKLMLEAELNSQ